MTKKKKIHPNLAVYKFKPGQSGNPKGRPRKCRNRESLLAEFQKQLIEYFVHDPKRDGKMKKPANAMEVVAYKLVKQFLDMNTININEIGSFMQLMTGQRILNPEKSQEDNTTAIPLSDLSDEHLKFLKNIMKTQDKKMNE